MEQLVIENLNDEDARLIKELLKKFKNVRYSSSFSKASKKEKDTYPYNPQIIKYDDYFYDLSRRLASVVDYQENSYIIRNDELDITVWGETREDAEKAFAFSFHSLFTNYALEKDEKLSKQAIGLKKRLVSLVKSVVRNEAKKK